MEVVSVFCVEYVNAVAYSCEDEEVLLDEDAVVSDPPSEWLLLYPYVSLTLLLKAVEFVLLSLDELLFCLLDELFHVLLFDFSVVLSWFAVRLASILASVPRASVPILVPIDADIPVLSTVESFLLVVFSFPLTVTTLFSETLLLESSTTFPLSSVWVLTSVKLSFQSFDRVQDVVSVVECASELTIEFDVLSLIVPLDVIVSEIVKPLVFPKSLMVYKGTFSICPISYANKYCPSLSFS